MNRTETKIDTYSRIKPLESSIFARQELEANGLYFHMKGLGIWEKMEEIGKKEPAMRCAQIASQAASKLNETAKLAGLDPLVSPRVTYLVGLLFKSGEAIDEDMANQFKLREMDPRIDNLYKFPFYAPDRNINNTPSLRMALLLQKLNYPWFAKLILHGPYPEFFEQAELPNVLVALANANLAKDENHIWHSYLQPAAGLLAIAPYAERSDMMSAEQTKDWIGRSRVVAINTTLHHILRSYIGISFTDENFGSSEKEMRQRWIVMQEIFKEFGFPLPKNEDISIQNKHLDILKQWMKKNNVERRIKKKQAESEYLLDDHSRMVGKILSHIGKHLNMFAQHFTGGPIFNEEYLYYVGYCHDAIKAFDEKELSWILELQRHESEFFHIVTPEVVVREGVSLANNDDTQLFSWLKTFDDETTKNWPKRSRIPSIAYDFLVGSEYLHTIISTLLSYADLTVYHDKKENKIKYNPDITDRFINVVYDRTSDPHLAVIGYAKLMAVAATLSWYLGIPLPKKGTVEINNETVEIMQPQAIVDEETAIKNLKSLSKVMNLFGIAMPKELRALGNENK